VSGFTSLDTSKQAQISQVAGRSLSPWILVCTMLAAWIGTGSIVGNAGKTYQTGLAALILP
jgi:Na+/proline symporter